MQGYDSVAVRADVEIGGTDQRFNLLAGRTLQPAYRQEPQDILMTNLILGTDKRKMSSSWGNTINLTDDPDNMFGKVMSIPDDLIVEYFVHCTRIPMASVKKYEKELTDQAENPRDIKLKLANEITSLYHGKELADAAEKEFVKVFSNKELPTDIPTVSVERGNYGLPLLLLNLEAAPSLSEAKRLIEQGAVKIDSVKITDPQAVISVYPNMIINVGKRKIYKVSC